MKGYTFNKEGELVPVTVKIVWGSPASGKTTYVKEHMAPGDMVVDLDYIKQSISLADKTDASDNLLNVAMALRDKLYEMIRDRDVEGANVWVVAGLPKEEEREQLRRYLKADEMVHMDATYDECITRAMNDEERRDKEKQVRIIDKWFDLFYDELNK